MNKLLLIATFTFLSVFVSAQGLEDVIVERYYISDANDATATDGGPLPSGSVTYRIFVDMAPGYQLQAVYASQDNLHDLRFETTTQFFNNNDRGATTPNGISASRLGDNTVMLDSWISLGGAGSGKVGILKADDPDGAIQNADGFLKNEHPLAGVPIKTKDGLMPGTPASITLVGLDQAIGVFDDVNDGPVFSTANGNWYTLPGANGPTADNRVLIAQITTNGVLTFRLNLQLRRESDFLVEKYVHSNPVTGEIFCEKCTFNGVITGVLDHSISQKKFEFRVFPNPANELINVQIANWNEGGNYTCTILNMIGKTVMETAVNTDPEGFIRNMNIATLPKGAYIIKVTSHSGLSTARLFMKNQ